MEATGVSNNQRFFIKILWNSSRRVIRCNGKIKMNVLRVIRTSRKTLHISHPPLINIWRNGETLLYFVRIREKFIKVSVYFQFGATFLLWMLIRNLNYKFYKFYIPSIATIIAQTLYSQQIINVIKFRRKQLMLINPLKIRSDPWLLIFRPPTLQSQSLCNQNTHLALRQFPPPLGRINFKQRSRANVLEL